MRRGFIDEITGPNSRKPLAMGPYADMLLEFRKGEKAGQSLALFTTDRGAKFTKSAVLMLKGELGPQKAEAKAKK
jgi:hypothetical protein